MSAWATGSWAASAWAGTVWAETVYVTVPDVVGQTEAAAISALDAAGLGATTVGTSSSVVAEGAVISQTPGAGEQAPSGSSVLIMVSTGEASPGGVQATRRRRR